MNSSVAFLNWGVTGGGVAGGADRGEAGPGISIPYSCAIRLSTHCFSSMGSGVGAMVVAGNKMDGMMESAVQGQ